MWVRKEALIKAGYGSLDTLSVMNVSDPAATRQQFPGITFTEWRYGDGIGACAAPGPAAVWYGIEPVAS
jgi:hypothetical protein